MSRPGSRSPGWRAGAGGDASKKKGRNSRDDYTPRRRLLVAPYNRVRLVILNIGRECPRYTLQVGDRGFEIPWHHLHEQSRVRRAALASDVFLQRLPGRRFKHCVRRLLKRAMVVQLPAHDDPPP